MLFGPLTPQQCQIYASSLAIGTPYFGIIVSNEFYVDLSTVGPLFQFNICCTINCDIQDFVFPVEFTMV